MTQPTNLNDIADYYGYNFHVQMTIRNVEQGQRKGQAFMNTLWAFAPEDYNALTGTLFDPFYRDSWGDVIQAFEWLLTR